MYKLIKEKTIIVIIIIVLTVNLDILHISANNNKLNYINSQVKFELLSNKYVTRDIEKYLLEQNIEFEYKYSNNKIYYTLQISNDLLFKFLSKNSIINDKVSLD